MHIDGAVLEELKILPSDIHGLSKEATFDYIRFASNTENLSSPIILTKIPTTSSMPRKKRKR